jgi:hypothetical protein
VQHQVDQTWDAKSPIMAEYRRTVDEFAICFLGFEVKHVQREENWTTDAPARLGSERAELPKDVFLHHLYAPSIKGKEAEYPLLSGETEFLLVTPDWTVPYLKFLLKQGEPEDEVERKKLAHRCKGYTVIAGQLYKRSVSGIFQRCISPDEERLLFQEIHSGTYGHHAQPRSLVAKAFWQGFIWLTAKQDAEHLVKRCKGASSMPSKSIYRQKNLKLYHLPGHSRSGGWIW